MKQIEPTQRPVRPGGYREVWLLAYPVIITLGSESVMGVVDTLYMGWVGTNQQAAVGLASMLTLTLLSFFNGTISTTNTFVAQYHGGATGGSVTSRSATGKLVWQALYFSGLAAAIVWIGLVPNTYRLIDLVSSSGAVSEHASVYMNIRIQGALLTFVSFTVVNFLRGIGDTRTPMKITLAVNGLNIVFNYALVFGAFGLPAMGVTGVALGTVLSQAIACAAYLVVYLRPSLHDRFQTRQVHPPDPRLMWRFLRVGLPVGVWWVLEMGGWTMFTVFVSSLGAAKLAAHNIVIQVLHLSFMPGVALEIAATTLVGQYLGAGDPRTAHRSAVSALKLGMAYMTCMGVLFILLRHPIAGLFNPDPQVALVAANLLLMAGFIEPFDGLAIVTSGAIRGAGDTRWPMVVSLVLVWVVFLPCVYVLGDVLGYDIYGAWAAAGIYLVLLGGMMFGRFMGGRWKTMRV